MKKKMAALSLALLICLSLAGCGDLLEPLKNGEPELTDTPSAKPSQSVPNTNRVPELEQAIEAAGAGAVSTAPADAVPTAPADQPEINVLLTSVVDKREYLGTLMTACTSVEPEVTIAGREAASQRISSALSERLALSFGGESVDEFYEDACASYGYYLENPNDYWSWAPYWINVMAEVTRGDGKVLSFCSRGYRYSGAAHGYTDCYGITFSTESGERLELADIFSDIGSLTDIAIAAAYAQEEEDDGFYFMLDEFVESALAGEAWYLNDEGLCLIANEGEVGATYMGVITFNIPYSELEGVIKPEYIPDGAAAEAAGISAVAVSDTGTAIPRAAVSFGSGSSAVYITADENTAPFSVCCSGFSNMYYTPEDTEDGGLSLSRSCLWVNGLRAGECISVTATASELSNYGLMQADGTFQAFN